MDITREQKMLKRLKRHNLSRTEITDKSIWDLQIKMGWLPQFLLLYSIEDNRLKKKIYKKRINCLIYKK